MFGRCETTSASRAAARIRCRTARSLGTRRGTRRGTTGETVRPLMPSPGIAGLANSLKRHVAPGPPDCGQKRFELEERRGFGIDDHWTDCTAMRAGAEGGSTAGGCACYGRLHWWKRRLVMIGVGHFAAAAMDIRERANRREVFRSAAQDLLELRRRLVELADFNKRAAESDSRGDVRRDAAGVPRGRSRSPRQTCPGGGIPRRAPRRKSTPGPAGPGASIPRVEGFLS